MIALMVSLLPNRVCADVKPHALFSDGVVLQRDAKVRIWGTATDGEKIVVSFQKQTAQTTAQNGAWSVTLGPFSVGEPASLIIKGNNTIIIKDVVVGEVWVASGQSNMEWPMHLTEDAEKNIREASYPNIRLFTVPKRVEKSPVSTVNAQWVRCQPNTVRNFSAVAYYFGRKLHQELAVPVGLINTSWGGTPAEAWTSRDFLESHSRLKSEIVDPFDALINNAAKNPAEASKAKKRWGPNGPWSQNAPSALYNGMIEPIIPFRIRGAIWYQGESNAGRADQYRQLFPRMIECWRAKWNQGDFPFLFVQLAPFKSSPVWAELRESQRETDHKVKNTAMAVITDVGDAVDIHPRKKQPVGERLALAALSEFYGKNVVGHSPDLKKFEIKGREVVCHFDHVGSGLEIRGGTTLTGFTIRGADGAWVNADARIEGSDQVVVSSKQVDKPNAVRFGWSDLPTGNLFNKEGFPATPFRTDHDRFTTATPGR
jgi:sialate O-acetylesterase